MGITKVTAQILNLFLTPMKFGVCNFILAAFLISPLANAQYTKLIDFAGVANGSHPHGSLILQGNVFYGMTYDGGTNNLGTIFKINSDGTGYSKLLDFAGTTNGSNPLGSLISDGTFLYGMTRHGGVGSNGVIFKIMPDGSGYTKLLDFGGSGTGTSPWGSLISDGTFFYGMTYNGGSGTNSNGVIFKIKPDGTELSKLLDFGTTNGSAPHGSLISDGTSLYGMTYNGGTNNLGTIFKINSDGTGYFKLLDFAGSTNGRWPNGDLISDGTFLYGMTYSGGTNNYGTIFKITPDGTGYVKLFDFLGGINGGSPHGSLISDGTFLYGKTESGGTKSEGIIFKIKPDGTGYSKLLDLADDSDGISPTSGSLIFDGAFLYGMTCRGGTNNMGTIFKYGSATGIAENNLETDFTVYPNPSKGEINLKINQFETLKMNDVDIYNMFGEKIFEQTLNMEHETLNLNVSNGIYFLQLKTEEGIASKKLIITK
ncbi:MAG: T9SS type A sorting domain-containing protein [Bacteroidetes bacterium]|nr:MAG: T9SS type A sorting domain-containing protein [Bacteroidota bacterium]